MSTPEIADLLRRVALKDRAAFASLYARTSAKLFGVCLRILRDRGEAEEALQEIFVKIWHKAGQFASGRASPMTWLISIARNHAIDVLRARKPASTDISEAVEVNDPAHGPETMALLSDEGRRIDACMEELDSKHAFAVREAYVEGASYQELAARFNVPLNTMRTWLRRSLRKLRECLER